jgi:hypothetical protein
LVSFDRQSGLATPLALMPQCFEHWGSEVDSMLLHWFASA